MGKAQRNINVKRGRQQVGNKVGETKREERYIRVDIEGRKPLYVKSYRLKIEGGPKK